MGCLAVELSIPALARLRNVLNARGVTLQEASSRDRLPSGITEFQAVFLGSDGTASSLEALDLVRRQRRTLPIIVVVANGSEDFAVQAYRAGATEYLKDPLDSSEVERLLCFLSEHQLSPARACNWMVGC
jgi:DNA-binding NtrC family response regulator